MSNQNFLTNDHQGLEIAQTAMVVGNGLTASIVASSLNRLGAQVTQVIFGPKADSLFYNCESSQFDAFLRILSENTFQSGTVSASAPVEIAPIQNGFLVTFEDGYKCVFNSIFVATEGEFNSLPRTAPDTVTRFTPDCFDRVSGRSVTVVLDYDEITDPSIGMQAIKTALNNKLAGGESSIIFRHAPVRGLFGEKLYGQARSGGVKFFRFGNILPLIEPLSDDKDSNAKFRISVQDVIETGTVFTLESEQVFMACNPIPVQIPGFFSSLLIRETDHLGFLLQDSVHCSNGKSFCKGVYCVGPSVGMVDLMETSWSAAAAAAEALSWPSLSLESPSEAKVSVSDQCIRCLTCLRLCPHSAISLSPEPSRSRVSIADSRCLECGICVAECPRTAMDLTNFPEEGFSCMLEKLRFAPSSKPYVVFGCYRSAGRALSEISLPPNVIFSPVSCAGRLSESILSATLLAGARGLLILGCHHGNCRSNNGTDWAKARVSSVASRLNSIFGNNSLVSHKTMAANESQRMSKLVDDFVRSFEKE
ncbi:MAG: hydrogenase iron-sulfur subunit [Desulfomonilaceae bacterium]|jgi:heterodisulfide reductase subunit A